ncbi:hypothetical protein G6O67_006661 [Ophiocordyceps sinensis]|uniref:Uncharacterized protein n=1 Tax=Ophiocordyceps sinensis TaxID=72228 RepID=A0A8H4LW48_9HYPO|nr:hypothetical protein G6O67_006661 [Ophiocordyceps sinensis]
MSPERLHLANDVAPVGDEHLGDAVGHQNPVYCGRARLVQVSLGFASVAEKLLGAQREQKHSRRWGRQLHGVLVQHVPHQQRPKDDSQGMVAHQVGCRERSPVAVLARRQLCDTADQAQEAEDGANELSAELRLDGANGQGDEPRADLCLLGARKLGLPVELGMNGDECVEESERSEDAAGQDGQQPLKGRRDVVDRVGNVQRKVGGAHRSSNIVAARFHVAIVVEQGRHDPHRAGDSKDSARVCVLGQVLRRGAQTGGQDEGAGGIVLGQVQQALAAQAHHFLNAKKPRGLMARADHVGEVRDAPLMARLQLARPPRPPKPPRGRPLSGRLMAMRAGPEEPMKPASLPGASDCIALRGLVSMQENRG